MLYQLILLVGHRRKKNESVAIVPQMFWGHFPITNMLVHQCLLLKDMYCSFHLWYIEALGKYQLKGTSWRHGVKRRLNIKIYMRPICLERSQICWELYTLQFQSVRPLESHVVQLFIILSHRMKISTSNILIQCSRVTNPPGWKNPDKNVFFASVGLKASFEIMSTLFNLLLLFLNFRVFGLKKYLPVRYNFYPPATSS